MAIEEKKNENFPNIRLCSQSTYGSEEKKTGLARINKKLNNLS